MTKRIFFYLGLSCACFFCFEKKITAQIIQDIATTPSTALQKTTTYFNEALGQQSRLYIGKEYQFYFGLVGLAYFKTADFYKKGSVIYDGFTYENVPLLYDGYKDLLVSLLPNGVIKYSFLSEKVTSFELHGHHFIYIDVPKLSTETPLKTGFFDLMYAGKSKFLVKRYKVLQETTGTQALKRYFIDKNAFYLQKDGTYYTFFNERSFLNLFKDRKKELQRYLRENKIKFKKDMEYAVVQLITYYDSLTN